MMWTYKGVDVYSADRNSSGIRWYARHSLAPAVLRSDTKDGMKHLISKYAKGRKKNPRRYRRNCGCKHRRTRRNHGSPPFRDDHDYYTGMPAFKVTYHNGKSYVTSMAKGVTLADAKRYFLGNWMEQPDEKTMLQVVKVEQVRENPYRRSKRRRKSRGRRR